MISISLIQAIDHTCALAEAIKINISIMAFLFGNILGANQPLSENYGNFNLSHMMLIQRSA
jgi:hypothetical protein